MSSDTQSREDCTRRHRRYALTLLALGAGCVGYEADPLVPEVELRELIQRSAALPAEPPPRSFVGAESWFPVVEEIDPGDGLSLAEANTVALFYAPELVLARTQNKVAAAQLLQAGLLPNPQLFIAPMWSTDNSALLMPGTLFFGIPIGGELSAEEDAARAKLDSAAWRVVQTELSLLQEVRLTFVRIAALRGQRAQQELLRAEAQRIVEWVEQLATVGEVDALTLGLARMDRDGVVTSIQRLDIELMQAATELRGMIGLHPTAEVELITTESLLSATDLPDADASRVLRHPALRAAELDYAEAEGLLRLEVARQYPNPRIGPSLEYDRGDLLLGFGLNVPIPLFDQNRGQIAEAVAMRQGARQRYQQTMIELASVETAARRQRDAAVEYLRVYLEGPVMSATQAEQALASRLQSGFANVLEVLNARRAISRVRVREVELRGDVAAATLRAAVAGGFVINEDVSVETEVER